MALPRRVKKITASLWIDLVKEIGLCCGAVTKNGLAAFGAM
jgi:hypothetical protein